MEAFRTLLIANRGEIAVRIARTARSLGYRTVAVFSDADANAPHVQAADLAVHIGPADVGASYLSVERVLGAAAEAGADAVHPGYGFLSENADFVAACKAAGLVFVGPPAEAVRLMGNKRAAKERLAQAGVPLVPGFHAAGADDAALAAAADDVGYPLMVKAAAGGGGRGMRRVNGPADLAAALRSAREEAQAAFGDGELLLERALEGARHVEVQVFADAHGNVLHLGERDCSVQRRHQKIIEEAPAPGVDPGLRERMGLAAVAAARAIGYRGAGTVEFLLAGDGAFYFLEMNTRLQVEHPVTESVCGVDLVAWQLRVAAGEPLPLTQAQVTWRGHAIEARLYAEDAYAGHLPSVGRVLAWEPPTGEGIRVDHAVAAGMPVGTHYDGLLAKVVAWGEDRNEARRRLIAALQRMVLLGLETNAQFLAAVLDDAEFAAGGVDTDWLSRADAGRWPRPQPPEWFWHLATAMLFEGTGHPASRWALRGMPTPMQVTSGDRTRKFGVTSLGAGRYEVRSVADDDAISGEPLTVALDGAGADGMRRMQIGPVQRSAAVGWVGDRLWMACDGEAAMFTEPSPDSERAREAAPGDVVAPLNGRVLSVAVAEGEPVSCGQPLLVLEAMKLQHELSAERDGIVTRVAVRSGAQVVPGQLLIAVRVED